MTKKRILSFTIALLFSWFLTNVMHAQPGIGLPDMDTTPEPKEYNEKGISAFTIFSDQDFFAKSLNEDRNYTMGFKITLHGKGLNENWLILPIFRKGLDYLTTPKPKGVEGESFYSMSLKGSAFTPLDLCTPSLEVNPDDRPFSFVLGLSSSRRIEFDYTDNGGVSVIGGKGCGNKDFAISSSVHLGVLGLDIGKGFQTWAHEVHLFGSTREVPCMWDDQIGEGGELTGLVNVSIEKPLFNIEDKVQLSNLRVLISGMSEINLGYYTNMALGLDVGIGRFTENFLAADDLFDSSMNSEMTTSPLGAWRIVGGVRYRGVAYNALLTGQGKEEGHTLASDQVERFLWEYYLGIRLIPLAGIEIVYLPLVTRSPEFDTPLSSRHYWGAISITFKL